MDEQQDYRHNDLQFQHANLSDPLRHSASKLVKAQEGQAQMYTHFKVRCICNKPYLEGDGLLTTGSFTNLTIGKTYEAERAGDWYRVWDDFGEDYLYPLDRFEPVD